LLLLVTLVCLWLGFFERSRRQRKAVHAIRQAYGDVYYSGEWQNIVRLAPGRTRLRQVQYSSRILRVERKVARYRTDSPNAVELTPLDATSFQVRGDAPGTANIEIRDEAGDVYSLAVVVRAADESAGFLASLEAVDLSREAVDERLLGRLEQLPDLRILTVRSSRLSAGSLERLSHFTRLQWLDLRGATVSKQDVANLRAALPACKILFGNDDNRPALLFDDA